MHQPSTYQVEVIKEEEIKEENIDESYEFGDDCAKEGAIELGKDLEIGDNTTEEDEEVVLFIEYKYCTICHIEQPLRCKHCKQCDHCVATHDHHCPWIGNCVGERNKKYFVGFLYF